MLLATPLGVVAASGLAIGSVLTVKLMIRNGCCETVAASEEANCQLFELSLRNAQPLFVPPLAQACTVAPRPVTDTAPVVPPTKEASAAASASVPLACTPLLPKELVQTVFSFHD